MLEHSLRQNELRKKILGLVAEYGELAGGPVPFVAGTTMVPPAGKVVGTPEMQHMVEASLDAWLTTGRFNALFEARWVIALFGPATKSLVSPLVSQQL
jgi:CDP-4-dehydro-6-deoxyglucose reductase, E1